MTKSPHFWSGLRAVPGSQPPPGGGEAAEEQETGGGGGQSVGKRRDGSRCFKCGEVIEGEAEEEDEQEGAEKS